MRNDLGLKLAIHPELFDVAQLRRNHCICRQCINGHFAVALDKQEPFRSRWQRCDVLKRRDFVCGTCTEEFRSKKLRDQRLTKRNCSINGLHRYQSSPDGDAWRVQLNAHCSDHAERALTADSQSGHVRTSVVFRQRIQVIENFAVAQDHLNAEHLRARHAVRDDADTASVCCDGPTDSRRVTRREINAVFEADGAGECLDF